MITDFGPAENGEHRVEIDGVGQWLTEAELNAERSLSGIPVGAPDNTPLYDPADQSIDEPALKVGFP